MPLRQISPTTLVTTEEASSASIGRATRRRLNRSEYENVLRDILSAPWIEVKDQLPEDGESSVDPASPAAYGSNFGNSNQHTCFNMPALLADDGFKHGQQIGFDWEHNRNYNLCNLFVSMIQRMGSTRTSLPVPPARCVGWK